MSGMHAQLRMSPRQLRGLYGWERWACEAGRGSVVFRVRFRVRGWVVLEGVVGRWGASGAVGACIGQTGSCCGGVVMKDGCIAGMIGALGAARGGVRRWQTRRGH